MFLAGTLSNVFPQQIKCSSENSMFVLLNFTCHAPGTWSLSIHCFSPSLYLRQTFLFAQVNPLPTTIRDPAFIWGNYSTYSMCPWVCVCVCDLRCGRSTRAAHGSDRSAIDFSFSSGNLIKESTSSGTAGHSAVVLLAGPGSLLLNTLEENKNVYLLENTTFKIKHTREINGWEIKYLMYAAVSHPVVCP